MTKETHLAAVAAIQFALSNPEGMEFLRLWNEGEFDILRRDWPEAPDSVYIGAESTPENLQPSGEEAAPPHAGVKTLSEFMAEQEALHPGIHDKVQAAADELRASLAQQPAEPSKTVNVVGMPEFDGLLDHIYEYGTAAEGVIEKANAFARAVIARYAPQQPVAVDRAYPTPRNRAEAVALARLALAYLGVIDAHIDAAVARCETDLATQHREPTP